MKNKRNYIFLFESIVTTVMFFCCLVILVFIIWFGVLHPREGTNPIATLFIGGGLFVGAAIVTAVLIITSFYSYWTFQDDSIVIKKLFSKRKQIKLTEITKVEKTTTMSPLYGIYSLETYVIYSNDKKIEIMIREEKDYLELISVLNKFIDS